MPNMRATPRVMSMPPEKSQYKLNAVKQNSERNDSTAVRTVLHDDVVYQNSRAVGDDDFFEVTPERQLNANLQVVPAQLALCGSCGAS